MSASDNVATAPKDGASIPGQRVSASVQHSLLVLCAAQNLYKAAGVSQVGLQLRIID